jgi:hypothetical protein
MITGFIVGLVLGLFLGWLRLRGMAKILTMANEQNKQLRGELDKANALNKEFTQAINNV